MIATVETSRVHEATIPELWVMARHGHEFYEEAGLPGRFVPSVWVQTWATAIESGKGALFVWKDGDKFAGFLGGMTYQDPNDGELMSMELFWFVRKECRGGLCAARLMKAFEAWSRDRGCRRISMVHLINEASSGLPHFYSRMGYRPIETHYVKEL